MTFNPRFPPQFDAINVSTDVPKAKPGPKSVSSTVRPKDDPQDHPRTVKQQSGSTAEHTSPTHTVSSEPRTDVTIVHDSFGRVIQPSVHSHPQAGDPLETSQPPSTHTSATVIDERNRFQDAAQRSLGPPFVDTRETTAALSSVPRTPPTHRLLSADSTGSPLRFPPSTATRILSLSTSPRTSEGLSMQYDMTPPRFGSRTVAGDTVKMVQKWRIHFAKPPKSATLTSLAKPVTTEALVRNLELDEGAVRFSFFSFLLYLSSNRHANAGSYHHRGVPSKRAFSKQWACRDRCLILLLTAYLRSLQVHSGCTLAMYHPDLHFCMTPYCLNPLKRHTSWSGVRQRPARSLGCTSRLPRRNMLNYTHSCMLRGRCVILYLFTCP